MKNIIVSVSRGGFTLLAITLLANTGFAQEAPEKGKQLPASILRKYDADRNGILNEEEKAAWKADLQKGRAEAQTRRLEQYDANQDGKLDKAEKAAAKAGGSPKKSASESSNKSQRKSGGSASDREGSDEYPESAVASKSGSTHRKDDQP